MFKFSAKGSVSTCDGVSRRDFLQAGTLGALGLTLPLFNGLRAMGAVDKAKDSRACIMIFNLGAPSQMDTWDPKPEAAREIRGPFKTIKTNNPDIQLTEIFPRMAKLADKFSLVRSVYHTAAAVHDTGHQMMQTGRLFSGGINTPHAGCALEFLKGRRTELPAHVILPEPMGPTGGNLPHGQDAGFLGKTYDPFVLNADPSAKDFKVPDLLPPKEISEVRLQRRRELRHLVDDAVKDFEASESAKLMDANFTDAYRLMTSENARDAFALEKEPASVRERYGMNRFGQCCLLARRLVERGVRFVTVNTFITVFNEITWDIHGSKPFTSIEGMRDLVAPMYDQAYSALIEDLHQRGMLEDTLVCNLAEFGRTPKVNPAGGRDHWPGVWTVGFAGGGVKGGRVVGKSDEIGGYPAERPQAPANIVATIYHSLGIDLETELPGPQGRPFPLIDRGFDPIKELFSTMLRGALLWLLAGGSLLAADASSFRTDASSFRNQVQPILARFGCSAGACHGAAAGQGGFKLSLRGYDDEGDFLTITKSSLGRRVCLDDPARSLLLLKPTKTIPHKGGERFKTGSPEYKIIAEWIAQGCPPPAKSDARIERIEVSPAHATLEPNRTEPLKVTAFFNDGHTEDVTRWTKYTAGNTSVATVDEDGVVKVVGHGEGTITAWYLSRLAIGTITVPYEKPIAAETFATLKPRNFIDERVLEKLRELNLPPSDRCTDAEFIRRASLDTIGVLPTPEETRAFLAETTPGKRDHLIDALLARPEFVDYWAYHWSDLLLVNSDKLPEQAMWSYYQWIRRQVELNTPWDKMVRNLVTATGSTLQNGAGNFFVLHDEPTKIAETISVAFLGMSINCAKCHNHPMEKWTNDQYYAFANLFSRVRLKNGTGPEERVIYADNTGDLVQPLRGKPQPPTPLDAQPISLTSSEDRRIPLANWLTSPENPYFARSITNRVWKNFFAVGLVEAVDDLRMTNPSSNEKLLSEAARFLAKNDFDLKALMREILRSETYQRSSVARAENKDDTRFYARYYPRRLMAEVMLDAVSQVTAEPTTFRLDKRNANRGIGGAYPMGYRALQLPDSNTVSYFLASFGRPDRVRTCDCERTNEPSMAQALHIANGDTINQKLSAKDNRVAQLLASGKKDAEIVEDAYLLALSRAPSEHEKEGVLKILAAANGPADKRAAVEDLFWGLMSSREFLFNH